MGTRVSVVPSTAPLLIVGLGSLRLGIPLEVVERVVAAVETTPLAAAPESIMGVVNIRGEIVPVLDLRPAFRLPSRPLGVDDQFVITRHGPGPLAVVVDEAREVSEVDDARVVDAGELLPGLDSIRGVVRLDDGLLLINDPERFLKLDEWLAIVAPQEARHGP